MGDRADIILVKSQCEFIIPHCCTETLLTESVPTAGYLDRINENSRADRAGEVTKILRLELSPLIENFEVRDINAHLAGESHSCSSPFLRGSSVTVSTHLSE